MSTQALPRESDTRSVFERPTPTRRPIPDSEFCTCGRFADETACHQCGTAICDEHRFRCEENGCWPHDYCDQCAPLTDDAHLCREHRLSYLDRQSAEAIEELEAV